MLNQIVLFDLQNYIRHAWLFDLKRSEIKLYKNFLGQNNMASSFILYVYITNWCWPGDHEALGAGDDLVEVLDALLVLDLEHHVSSTFF